MKAISIGEAQKLTSPNPFALLTVRKPDGKTNIMAISWWTYASNHPATLAVCLSQKGYSGECIKTCGHFGLSVPGTGLEESAFRCGTCSGRSVDKAAEFGVPLVPMDGYSQDMVDGSRICFSCKLTDTLNIGDHTMYIGQVEQIFADSSLPGLFAYNGYARLATLQ